MLHGILVFYIIAIAKPHMQNLIPANARRHIA